MPQQLLNQNGAEVAPSTDGLTVTPKYSPEGADAFRAFVAEWGPKCWLTTDFDADNAYIVYVQGENIDITCRPVPVGMVAEADSDADFVGEPGEIGTEAGESTETPS